MNTLIIRKKSLKTWLHTDSILGDFIISKFYFNSTNLTFQIVEQGQSKRIMYNISDITLYNTIDGGGAETFATISELSLRLEQLNYPAFQYDGQIVSIANLITEGTNITIVGDGTESSPYVISASGSAGGTPTLQEVTTEGNETTDDIIVRDGDWTLNLKKDIGLSPLVTMEHDVYGARGIYTAQGIQLNSVSELETNCQMEILAERTNYIGIKVQNEDLVNAGNNLLTTLTFPLTSSIDQLIVQRDFVFPDKAEGTYTLATTDDVGGSQTLAQTLVLGNITDGTDISISDGDAVILDNTSKLKKGTTNAGLGGNNGIAFKCSLDYELKWEAGTLYIMEQDGFTIRETKYNFNLPTVTDDDTKGFIIGSRWLIENKVYKCTDATTGSAVWLRVYDSATDLGNTPAPTKVTVNSSTGTGTDLPLADATNAGLLKPADFTQLSTLATDLANINTDAVDKVTVKLALGISKGQAVYISSATGTNIIVSKASNSSEATSSKTLGLLATTGVTNDIVTVVTSGLLDGLDTSTATVGDPVWLGVSGNLIFGLASKPVAPAHLVYIGVVSRVHATVGEIFVRVQNGFELKEIHDVLITSVADNDILAYESSTSLWENKTSSALGLATQAQVDLRTREILQDFTDYTSTGVLTEQIISNQAITANDMKINSWLNFISTFSRTGTTNATVSIYLNTTSNSLSGAVKIATATITSTQSLPCFKRDFSINASSVLRGMLFSANAVTDEILTQVQSTTTLTLSSGYYLISTVTLNNVADTVTQRAINLKSSK